MQATRDMTQSSQPSYPSDLKANRMPEYVYRVAILVAVILLLWTVA